MRQNNDGHNSAVLRRYSDVILDPDGVGFGFSTGDDVEVPERFESDTHLLDFVAIYGIPRSEYWN